ncbi:uncharacterized protein LOC113015934 [Astatotilapia calliptera]|uniref:uncharacterized protein LOC113015934 n=1 Tax=Astatotilapia calliptera TaxID=8154 RepID=UPI000E4255F7|nr:uncharacterized protein LOC113015934 [Astatotilapia calliptera]
MINNQEEATIMEPREVRTTQVEEVRNVMEKIELNKGQDDPLSTSEGQVEHAGNKTSKGSSRGRVFGESHKKTKMVPEASRSRPKKKRPLSSNSIQEVLSYSHASVQTRRVFSCHFNVFFAINNFMLIFCYISTRHVSFHFFSLVIYRLLWIVFFFYYTRKIELTRYLMSGYVNSKVLDTLSEHANSLVSSALASLKDEADQLSHFPFLPTLRYFQSGKMNLSGFRLLLTLFLTIKSYLSNNEANEAPAEHIWLSVCG